MTRILLKAAGVAGATAGIYAMCRFLQVPALYLSALAGWGASCFLYSYELAGSRHRVRNGMEEKTPMQLAWMVAGLVCILTALTVLFLWF